jgi:predicted alpha/beta superfamily hydrolase
MQPKSHTVRREPRSPSRVVKVPDFKGRLASRALYVYLPPGYDDQEDRHYPVLYMHDGQNVFKAYARDSFDGTSWEADHSADSLIQSGSMQPVIIVGVANGGERRMAEYLPPYITLTPNGRKVSKRRLTSILSGRADRTARYYIEDVAGYVRARFRVLTGREHTATCGSSMGGLFSAFLAWEYPRFARNHALLSPSFWITSSQDGNLVTIDRIRQAEKPDLRIWLDSGTQDAPGRGNDDMENIRAARDVLLDKGFRDGPDFHYLLAKGAAHHESDWAKRLPSVLSFLFPGENARQPAGAATSANHQDA